MADCQIMDLTVCGSFGFGNAGDEAVPLALTDLAGSLGIDLRVNVVGRYAEVDLPNVVGLGQQNEARRKPLHGHPLMFIGGGMIEPRKQCVLLRCQPLIRELEPSRAIMFASSVEPGVTYPWLVRRQLRRAIGRLDHCSVRDVLSAEAISEFLPREETTVTGDIVLWMNAADERPGESAELDRYIAVNLINRWGDDPKLVAWLADHLVQIAHEHEASIVFVPCSVKFDNDGIVHHRVAAAMREKDAALAVRVLDQTLSPRELAAVLRDAQLTVGMRLHACIISYAQQTPCVGLVYHPKLIGFARTAGIEQCFLPQTPPAQQSTNHHGYRMDDLNLTDCDLTAAAQRAIEMREFSRLPILRDTLQSAFASALNISTIQNSSTETSPCEVTA